MVDNRGISPVSGYFKSDNASANKMSEEKNGQGGEFFAQDMQEEETQQNQTNPYQDRSAQLRASLESLAMVNAGSIRFKNALKNKLKEKEKNTNNQEEEIDERIYDE